MSEDNQVTTAIPRTLDTDATVVTPKPDAPAAPSASDETRVNPKITPEVMDRIRAATMQDNDRRYMAYRLEYFANFAHKGA